MLPYVGGGSTLRGFTSHRFRDQNGLPLQAEWRIMVNRFIDTAVFYDAGKVAARRAGSRSRRAEERLRLRRRVSTDRSPRRCGSRWRGAPKVWAHLRDAPRFSEAAAMSTSSFSPRRTSRPACLMLVWSPRSACCASAVSTKGPHFYPDDPIAREPESQDASKAQPYDIGSLYEMANNLFVTAGYKPSGMRAKNINTIDEVPDSSWFTNRIGDDPGHGRRASCAAPIAAPHLTLRAGCSSERRPPAPIRASRRGTPKARPGSSSSIPRYFPEGATGAVAVATKIFWALGYNQVESFLTTFDPKRVEFDPKATIRRPVRRQDAVHAGRHQRDPRARRAKRRTGPIASSPAG